jgi:hypothetical protein
MDLKEAWRNLEKEKLSKPVQGTVSIPKHSKHPVDKLIQTFGLGLVFCIVFEMFFVYLFFAVDQTIVKVGMAVIIVLYAFLFAINFKVLQKLRRLHKSDDSVLKVLHGVHSIVSQTIKFQQKISWGFFPMCVASGFVLGVSLKKDAAAMILQPKFYIILLITMALVTPACYFLTKWMTRISYGKYLDQIEDLIRQSKQD